ncbi:aminotransferase class I/II-fold pyridoxal phosphate-dependent enzyme [Microbacterium betulae]|uniref:Aminotransferase class I/II-fold pyridoxal phosphate-dependent enzyme n=1 Tax=Microbacterium betulae TaxID=2981139 RepID=A0AA97FG08_9MICO|nr:aminotransferase class I/II-fold pyridoxal phosphate-dependent enzyme [Microbacterium sp. AB]WOF22345.1 aminotransferase class I/II-fold pyridoxal phosphate-dependent enzyme [Microbacterium sp. AB]
MTTNDDPWRSISGRTAQAIAMEIRSLIEQGTVPPGDRLPTVRSLAQTLEVSPTTITEAWNRLLSAGLIRTEGRRGTFVSPRVGKRSVETALGSIVMDVAQGAVDASLLPDLRPAIDAALRSPDLHAHDFSYITNELRAAVEPSWPYRPEAWTTTDGGMDAASLALRALTRQGHVVALEQPASQRTISLLRTARRRVVGVRWDDEGPSPDELRHAIEAQNASLFAWQPRTHYPTGRTVSERRLDALAEVLETHPHVVVLEDDLAGDASVAPPRSLAAHLPDSVVRIRSFDAAYGLDLRTAVVSGSRDNIRALNTARGALAVWNSRILQNALAWLLQDADTQTLVDRAAKTYQKRRSVLVDAIRGHGVTMDAGTGTVVWVPVKDEVEAVDVLDDAGIASGLGSVCWLDASDQRHIRVPVGAHELGPVESARLAAAVAHAAR